MSVIYFEIDTHFHSLPEAKSFQKKMTQLMGPISNVKNTVHGEVTYQFVEFCINCWKDQSLARNGRRVIVKLTTGSEIDDHSEYMQSISHALNSFNAESSYITTQYSAVGDFCDTYIFYKKKLTKVYDSNHPIDLYKAIDIDPDDPSNIPDSKNHDIVGLYGMMYHIPKYKKLLSRAPHVYKDIENYFEDVKPFKKSIKKPKEFFLVEGMNIFYSGTFQDPWLSDASSRKFYVESNELIYQNRLTASTDVLVVGTKPSKTITDRAKRFNVRILKAPKYLELLNKIQPKADQ